MINICDKTLRKISKTEGVDLNQLKKNIRAGYVVVPKNRTRDISKPCAIGKGLTTKINANIGLSPGYSGIAEEMKKMKVAVDTGADTVMDLSTGPLLGKLRNKILAECPVPVGTVPVYELACDKKKRFISMNEDDFMAVLRKQAEEGVDFFTIHSGITLEIVNFVTEKPRILNIVSRGGALLASWMISNQRENPFFSRFDEIIALAREYDIVLSLGDSLRPGAISDATDRLQIQELLVLGDLQKRALARGVQVMIEGPGHVPLDQIEANVKLEKSICHGAPFYVLGPLVTDAAPGYDHIVGAIGGAIAAQYGADFLCYVTPAEHVRLPLVEDVRQGVIASKIAAHAADIVKKIPSALARDMAISKARAERDWKKQFKLALDPYTPEKLRKESLPPEQDVCTMCSEYCSIKVLETSLTYFNEKRGTKRRTK
ncbi:MAG: phosphomethylpyrimidine synthase ThiC [Candidatus Omnitrophota bacterium]